MLKIEKIKVEPGLKLGDIIRDVEKGKLRIPRFQREFVWERSKVVKLLDSIYHQFPIGSFFFWEAPSKYNKFFRNIAELKLPEPDERDDLTFVLDGQQRITSLYATVKGLTLDDVDYGDICFYLKQKEFVIRKADNKRYIALCEMLDEGKQFEIYDKLSQEDRQIFTDCRFILINYPFSVVLVRDTDLDDACDIFERINQEGKRLSLADLIVARTWSEDFDLREKIKEFNKTLSIKGFEELEVEAVTESLSLNIKGGCTRSIQLDLTSDEVKNVWQKTIESINLAIDFLRGNLGVKRFSFLPYRGIIPILNYYFYKSNNRAILPEHRKVIERWFWRVSFSERYGGAAPTRMGEDKKLFEQIIMNTPVSVEYPVNINAEDIYRLQMKTTSAIKNAVICLLARRSPKHFKNNTTISLDDAYFSDFNSPEKHHIFPASFLEQKGIREFSLANFCFLPAELNKEISNRKPSEYFKEIKETNLEFLKTMETHLIPIDNDSGIWTDDYEKFICQRAEIIKKEIELVIGT